MNDLYVPGQALEVLEEVQGILRQEFPPFEQGSA